MRLTLCLILLINGIFLTPTLCPAAPLAEAVPKQAPPNIVLIISDDQAWTDYSFMGHPQIETPNLDRLAQKSLTFTRGYVPNSLCRPSLVSIMTGLYPHQHGIVGNDPPPPPALVGLPKGKLFQHPDYTAVRNDYLKHIDDDPVLPKLLQAKGYVSHQSGKWWEGHYSKGGFTAGMTHGDRTRGGRHGDKGLVIGREGLEPIQKFVDQAIENKDPFLVYYAPFLPHTPHTPPERLLKKYLPKTPHPAIAKYWAMCDWFDETVGELVQMIEDKGVVENTIFVYVTDNGWINEENASRYAPKSKRSQYDGGLRTPIMIRWDGHVKPRLETEKLASSIDIVPTLLHAVGLEKQITPEMDGLNLLDSQAVNQRNTLFGEIFEHDIVHMTDPVASLRFRWVIEGDWKLIVPHPAREPEAQIELYQLKEDPTEEQNLAGQHPEKVKHLQALLDEWWPVE